MQHYVQELCDARYGRGSVQIRRARLRRAFEEQQWWSQCHTVIHQLQLNRIEKLCIYPKQACLLMFLPLTCCLRPISCLRPWCSLRPLAWTACRSRFGEAFVTQRHWYYHSLCTAGRSNQQTSFGKTDGPPIFSSYS